MITTIVGNIYELLPNPGELKFEYEGAEYVLRSTDNLKIDITVKWHEGTVSSVILGNQAVEHTTRETMSFKKFNCEWELTNGRRIISQTITVLSNRELDVEAIESNLNKTLKALHNI